MWERGIFLNVRFLDVAKCTNLTPHVFRAAYFGIEIT
jgi:hypothetical protein